MNEELDDAAVTAAVAGYPRTGRDLADGYLLAALVIRAMYDAEDPEIRRALRLYGDGERLEHLTGALVDLWRVADAETRARRVSATNDTAALADAAMTQALSPVPGEETREISRVDYPPPHEYRASWSGTESHGGCVWPVSRHGPDCGKPFDHPVHHAAQWPVNDVDTRILPATEL